MYSSQHGHSKKYTDGTFEQINWDNNIRSSLSKRLY